MNLNDILEDLQSVLGEKAYKKGTIRKWASGEFQKTDKGWVPVPGKQKMAGGPLPSAGKMPTGKGDSVGKMVAKAQKNVAAMFPKEKDEPAAAAGAPPAEPPKDEPPADEPPPEKKKADKPPEKNYFAPNPESDKDGDGVADAARVGVPAYDVPPPPGIPRLPNLNEKEREMESKFADAVEANTDEAVNNFYEGAKKSNWVFETDAAKMLVPEWSRPDLPPDEKGAPVHPERAAVRGLFNTALHQTANAVAKKAFLKRLDEIEKMDKDDPKRRVLVTSGGCAAGKGLSLAADPSLAGSASATWDAAGEQNATENPWVLDECEKRGIKATFLFVANDPKRTIADAVSRAAKIGRMVDTKVFADSYALGAKNFDAFHKKNKGKADFVIARAGKPPTNVDDVPSDALALKSDDIDAMALEHLDKVRGEIPDYVYNGATAGKRIWKGPDAPKAKGEAVEGKKPAKDDHDHRMSPAERKKLSDQFLKALDKGMSDPEKYWGGNTKDVKPMKALEEMPLVKFAPEVVKSIQREMERQGGKKKTKGEDIVKDLKGILADD